MKNFEELENFINSNKDYWKELLRREPYNLESITQFPNNPNWYILMYNLYESDTSNKIVQQCRGTVVALKDGGYRVICAPYLKFFNVEEQNAARINWNSNKLFVYEKYDGCLIKMFKYKGRDYWISNGAPGIFIPLTYTTDEFKTYPEILASLLKTENSKINISEDDFNIDCDWVRNIPDGYTLMFEVVSPQMPIVVRYNENSIIFHGIRDNEGNELDVEEAASRFHIPYKTPVKYNLSKLEDVKSLVDTFSWLEQEGVVVVDQNTWSRVKIKSPSYLSMKFIIDKDTPQGILNLVLSNDYDDAIALVPMLKSKILNQVEELNLLKAKLDEFELEACRKFKQEFNKDKKLFAEWVGKQDETLRQYYFSAIKNISLKEQVLERLKLKKRSYKEVYLPLKEALIK